MTRVTWIQGPLLASLATGPIFLGLLTIRTVITEPGQPLSALSVFGLLLVPSLPVGMLLSFLPNLAGSAVLANLGITSASARSPVLWASIGSVIGWTSGAALIGTLLSLDLLTALTGTICALICRRCTHWQD